MKLGKRIFLSLALLLLPGFIAISMIPAVAAAGCRQFVSGQSSADKTVSDSEDMKASRVASSSQPVMLGDKSQSVVLVLTTPGAKNDAKTLGSRVKTLRPGKRIYLVLRKLCAEEEPGVSYNLYLNLPPNVKPGGNNAFYVGSINFYNAVAMPENEFTSESDTGFFSFDVTGVIKNLEAGNLLKDTATITISPSGAPDPRAKALIGRIELIEQ